MIYLPNIVPEDKSCSNFCTEDVQPFTVAVSLNRIFKEERLL